MLVTAVALVLTLLFQPSLERTLLLFFYSAIVASALYGGLGPALLATALTILLVDAFLFPPLYALGPLRTGDLLALVVFSVTGAALSWLSESRRAARRHVEEEVRRTAMLTKQLRDYAIVGLDAAGHVTTWHAGAEDVTGFGAAEILGRQYSAFSTPEGRAAGAARLLLDAAAHEGRAEDEGWRVRRDGSRYWASAVVTPLRDDHGTLVGFSLVMRDLTDRRRDEEAFRRQAGLLEQTHDAVLVWQEGGAITYWNHGAEALYGYAREEAVGCVSQELLQTAPRAGTLAEMAAARVRDGHWEGMLLQVTRDGRRIVSESRQVLVRPPDATPYVLETNRDVTERIESEAEREQLAVQLARRVAELETLVNVVPVGIGVATDPACRDIRINPALAAQLGTGPDENASSSREDADTALPFRIVRKGREVSAAELPMQRAARDGVSVHGEELDVVLDGGRTINLLCNAAPLFDEAGRSRGSIGAFVEITARKRSEEMQQFLLHASRVLATSLELQPTLHQVAHLPVPRLADYCLVYLRNRDGSFRQVAAAHADPDAAPLLEVLGRLYRPDPTNPDSAVARAAETRRPVLAPVVTGEDAARTLRDPEALRVHQQLGPSSYLVVPLVARGEVIGVAGLLMSVSGRRFVAADLEQLELYGARAAFAIDNARLYSELRDAHDRDVRTAQLEQQFMQARLDTLRAQLNPHFLFNALNTIAMLVRREAGSDALRGIISLAELLRKVLSGRGTAEVRLTEELALVAHYLEVERLRFRDRLSVDTAIEGQAQDAFVPGFLLQPLVENAVRHGIAHRRDPGLVTISGRREADVLVLEVRDDGPGFPDASPVVPAAGIGLANTRERLERIYGDTHRFAAYNAPGGGAVVRIEIPFRTVGDPPLAVPASLTDGNRPRADTR